MRATGLVLALALWPLPAQTQEAISAKRGETIRLQSWAYFDSQCKRTGLPAYSTMRAPKLGQLAVSRGQIKIRRVAEAKLKNCIGRAATGSIVTYTAGARPGTDRIAIGRRRQGSDIARTDFVITVK